MTRFKGIATRGLRHAAKSHTGPLPLSVATMTRFKGIGLFNLVFDTNLKDNY